VVLAGLAIGAALLLSRAGTPSAASLTSAPTIRQIEEIRPQLGAGEYIPPQPANISNIEFFIGQGIGGAQYAPGNMLFDIMATTPGGSAVKVGDIDAHFSSSWLTQSWKYDSLPDFVKKEINSAAVASVQTPPIW